MSELAETYLSNPVRVEAAPPGKPADKISQTVHFIAQAEKTGRGLPRVDCPANRYKYDQCRPPAVQLHPWCQVLGIDHGRKRTAGEFGKHFALGIV